MNDKVDNFGQQHYDFQRVLATICLYGNGNCFLHNYKLFYDCHCRLGSNWEDTSDCSQNRCPQGGDNACMHTITETAGPAVSCSPTGLCNFLMMSARANNQLAFKNPTTDSVLNYRWLLSFVNRYLYQPEVPFLD